MTDKVASPVVIAIALPMNVEACTKTRSIDENTLSNTACVASVAPIGTKPPDSALATVTMSGCTPSCSKAKNLPVRPMPVCTSSQISKAPCRRNSACAAVKNPGGGMCTPLP